MLRWEYRVISLRDGEYTSSLNAYGQEGWELVTVAADVHGPLVPPAAQAGGSVPGLGKLGRAAAKLNELESGGEEQAPGIATTFLWVLRRPLEDDEPDYSYDIDE